MKGDQHVSANIILDEDEGTRETHSSSTISEGCWHEQTDFADSGPSDLWGVGREGLSSLLSQV